MLHPSAALGPGDLAAPFESFVDGFRDVFPRVDQFDRCRTYLRGLLGPPERKNLEAIAAAEETVDMQGEANLAQALQHFVSNSPWDHRQLLAQLRDQTRSQRADDSAVWVIHDGVFVKKGRHSVGVHRQFARSLGRKVNCQIGVILGQAGRRGYFPLAARLYLPQAWLREHGETAQKQIPEADRQALTRSEIALRLLDETRASGEPVRSVLVEAGYGANGDLQAELKKRGFVLLEGPGDEVAWSIRSFNGLKPHFGLDHFEGRNWHGWHHHVALVFAAYHFAAMHERRAQRQARPAP
jgi:SRSO17 transposase